jgi:predicted SprT family Zn-dependent metalloprotease
MNLYEARHLAHHLLREHGLVAWEFRFDHARRRFGACHYGTRRITLSRPLTLLNPIDQVRDTLLHEIAHALTPGDGHGRAWKAKCLQIGAQPRRCYNDDTVTPPPRPPAPYVVGCVRCDWWAERRHLSRRKLVCKVCREPVEFRVRGK